uniref:Transport and Golgi organization protein 6 n=1 Tax=Culex pipiens TaxID=7175 RepID=A0A8D8NJL3_CULPI
MDSKKCFKIIFDLAEAKPEDLNLSRLQSILNLTADDPNFSSGDVLWTLSQHYLHIMQQFLTTCLVQKRPASNDSDAPAEDILNPREQIQFFTAVDRIRQFTVSLYLPKELRGLTRCDLKLMVQLEPEEGMRRLRYCLEAFRRLFEFREVAVEKRLEYCVLEYIAGTFGLYLMGGSFGGMRDDELFKGFELFSLEAIFKSLLIIKGSPNVSLELAKQIHLELLRQTGLPGGFPVLCRTLLTNVPSDETPTWKKSEVIAKIVASKGHTKTFYRQVLKDCFTFYETSLLSGEQDNLTYVGTCIECLRQMYQLPPVYEELRRTIREYFVARFDVLAQPKELLSGSIVVERPELVIGLYLNYMAFSGSSCSSLNSSILVPYLQMFLKLYSLLPMGELDERNYLQTLVVFCLANREKAELESVLRGLLVGVDGVEAMKKFHPRIYLKNLEGEEKYSLQVGPGSDDDSEEDSLGPVLVEILKASNRNLLIYDVFVVLLKLFDEITSKSTANLLLDAEEQDASSCKQFFKKYVLIQALTDLISHRHFHAQLYENPAEILSFIKSALERAVEGKTQSEDLLEVMLSIFQEYLRRLQTRDDVQQIVKLLQRYKSSKFCTAQLRSQIEHICKDPNSVQPPDQDLTPYANATSLCLEKEPYCKVYGTTLLIKLLKERDPETTANKHAVLILALDNLKSVESYAFLNSVRLLVALCDTVLEADTLDALIREYQRTDNEVDFRLKVGEATLKTVDALGPVAFKYREQLVNCFLHGCKSGVDEFRASSLANLGNVCKTLSYQVHNFFYEMFLVIKCTIETDQYLPARRAAILVLAQLLEGIDNLLTLEDYLLLVYRFLKHVISTEVDDITRLQAAVALDHLNARTKEFLSAAQTGKLEKEIRIFGIKEEEAERRRKAAKGADSVLIKMLD